MVFSKVWMIVVALADRMRLLSTYRVESINKFAMVRIWHGCLFLVGPLDSNTHIGGLRSPRTWFIMSWGLLANSHPYLQHVGACLRQACPPIHSFGPTQDQISPKAGTVALDYRTTKNIEDVAGDEASPPAQRTA